MSALRQALGAQAAPHEFEHNGKVYKVGVVTQKVKTAFADWLWSQARKVAFDLREGMSEEQYERRLQRLTDDFLEGKFDFESETTTKALQTRPGMVAICSLLWGCSREEMLEMIVDRPAEVRSLLKLIIGESFPDVEQADPNAPKPG